MNRSLRRPEHVSRQRLSSIVLMSALLVGSSLVFNSQADAAIYKCISSSGAVTYSGRKCPYEDTTARIIDNSGVGAVRQRPRPAAAQPAPVNPQLDDDEASDDDEGLE